MWSSFVDDQSLWLQQRLTIGPSPQAFATVMDWLLNDPDHGYYGSGRVRFGPEGDFVTSPSQGSAFADLLKKQLWSCFEALAAEPGRFALIEWGPGDGELLWQLFGELGPQRPAWLDRLDLVLVESSAPLRERQQRRLEKLPVGCQWLSPEQLASAPRRGLVLAHELLDALPVERLVWQQTGWHQLVVGLDQFGSPSWQLGDPAADDVLQRLEAIGLPVDGTGLHYGWSTEWCSTLGEWLLQCRLGLQQGWLLVMDYALSGSRYYSPHRDGGTLLACRGQVTSPNLLAQPGEWDITAHVCTSLLEQWAPACGWQWRGACLQGEALLQLGLAAEISALSEPGPLNLAERLGRREQLLRLVDPHLLGGFSWMLLHTDQAPPALVNSPGWWP
jgi:SAM-dependent MidA family methyltransferase